MEVKFLVFIQVAFCVSEWLYSFLGLLRKLSISEMLSCGKHNDCIAGRILLSFSLEHSMTNSDSLFDLIAANLRPFSWAKLFSIAHGLIFLFFSGSTLHLNCVKYE